MKLGIETLCDFGYEFIGMDHFAKLHDELSVNQKNGTLHRNFQGYTTKGGCDLLGLGVSSISNIANSFSQNIKDLKAYYHAIDNKNHVIEKGLLLNRDDIIRGDVIRELMCNLYVDKNTISQRHNIAFDVYFADDLPLLTTFINEGLVENRATEIVVKQKARLLIRNICMAFDAYIKDHANQQRFSRII